MTKAEEKRARQEAAGIPDSKLHAAPFAEPTGEDRMLNSHIAGVLVRDLNLPGNVLAALDWNATDEGIAAKNARPMVRPPSGITMVSEPFDKALEERRDDVKQRDMPLWESRDPLKEVADAHAVPGMRPKFLSAARVKEAGGTGDYEVVKKTDGDPVMVKGMVLAHMPEARAKARGRHYQERGNQLLRQIGETYKREGGETAVVDQ